MSIHRYLFWGSFLLTPLLPAQDSIPAQPYPAESKMEAHVLKGPDEGEFLLYRQYSPVIEEGKKYPLLVFLHGYGERGGDNKAQLKHGAEDLLNYIEGEKVPCFFIMPQCPETMRWVRYERPLVKPPHAMDRYPTLPLQMVEKLIEAKLTELPVDPARIYVAGLSMGGFGTWELLCRRPELFAAGIPICGGGDPRQAEKIVSLPIWVFHGDADKAVIPDYSRLMVNRMKELGADRVKYTEYPGVGHDSWTETCRNKEVLNWLFQQVKQSGGTEVR